MHWQPRRRPAALLLAFCLGATSCSSLTGESTELAMVPAAPAITATAIPTTAPVEQPTPTALPIVTVAPTPEPSATPVPTAVPPTPVPPTQVPATAVPAPPAPPTAVPAAAPETPVPATAVPAATVAPEPTPEPTATVAPEPTPEPTATPEPTVEVVVESTPEPAGEGGPPAEHVVTNAGYVTFGQAGQATLRIPAALVEIVGFHEASHPGAQPINGADTGLLSMVLATRGRGTDARSAADIVVPPGEPLISPVTGTVIAARTYVLYCAHQDSLVYIEPDGLPGYEVRLFHVRGDLPAVGSRVIAGETVVASGGANQLPFESQVDEFTAEPSWPHVHLEVVDTSVPDDRPPGGGC